MRTRADYKKIFFEILSQCFNPDNIHLSQEGEGAKPGKLLPNGTIEPYSPSDNWMTYRFNVVSSDIFDHEARVYYDLHINIIGEECDKYANELKIKLETQNLLDYYSENEIGIETNSVPVVVSNVEINRRWYERRMLRFRFNFIETLDNPIEVDYMNELNDINIKEV